MDFFAELADKGLYGCTQVVVVNARKWGCFGIPAAGALGLERRQDRSEFLHPAVVQSKQTATHYKNSRSENHRRDFQGSLLGCLCLQDRPDTISVMRGVVEQPLIGDSKNISKILGNLK